MRQMFTSPRLENVERVAQLLTEAGIENRIQGGRTYKGHSRRQFSYTDKKGDASQQASVWVIKSDDYKRAREMMIEMGLMDAANAPSSFVPEALQLKERPADDPDRRLMRIKIALLFVLGAASTWMLLRMFLLR